MWSKIQKQLKLLGYYDAEIDNIPGPKTAAAICAALGIESVGSEHFTEQEVKCPCCGECLIEPETLEMAEKIRAAAAARQDPDFLIIARTDARTTLGVEEAILRIPLQKAQPGGWRRCKFPAHSRKGN